MKTLLAVLLFASSASLWAACQTDIQMNTNTPVGSTGNTITHVPTPTNDTDVANKSYVDAAGQLMVSNSGGIASIADAQAGCRDMTQDGYSDWRLPTLHEAINGFADSDAAGDNGIFYWTSTPYASGNDSWVTYAAQQAANYAWVRQVGTLSNAIRYRCVRGSL